MKNMEREKFEESWKKAFENADVSPSDNVWTNIELGLEKAKGGDLKKRLLFYQMLAAASVVFAMAIGGIGYYYSFRTNDSSNNNIALQETPSSVSRQPDKASASDEDQGDSKVSASKQKENQESLTDDNTPGVRDNTAPAKRLSGKDTRVAPTFADQSDRLRERVDQDAHDGPVLVRDSDPSLASLPAGVDDKKLTPIYSQRNVVLDFDKPAENVDPVAAMMARLAAREKEVRDEKEEKEAEQNTKENLWTSVGFAAGSFNTVQASAPSSGARSATLAVAAAPIVDQEAKATGYSYSMGVNVGTKLSERWVFQGGVNYLTHASEYVANNVVMDGAGNFHQQKFRAVSTNELMYADADDLSDKLVYSAPYNVNNNMRYLSIPLQAGYLVVNKTFGVQLNAGVATDLFLQNTISGESDQLAKTSQSMGSDSPYRTVNLSGLFGTEVSYRFGDHYRVSLNPGIRYPFNTIYKSELGVQSTPLTFDVGLRFRYIFK